MTADRSQSSSSGPQQLLLSHSNAHAVQAIQAIGHRQGLGARGLSSLLKMPHSLPVSETDEEMLSSPSKPQPCWRFGLKELFVVLVVLLVLSWACIGVLFYLYTTVNTKPASSATTATLTSASAVSPLRVVSMDSNGRVVQGAGRSIFKNVTAMNTLCPQHINIDAMFTDSYLASYQNSLTTETTLKVVKVDPTTGSTSVTTTPTTASFYQVATLNQNSGLFIGISQTFFANSSFVTAGNVDSVTGSVTLGASSLYGCFTSYSANPYITRLSDTSFAISHFCSSGNETINTQYGVVDPVTLSIKLSSSVAYVGSSLAGSSHHGVVGLDANNYFVMYQDYGSGLPLSAIKVSVNTTSLNISMTQPYPLNGESLNAYSFFDTAR